MPSRLVSVIKRIESLPNYKNERLIDSCSDFMKSIDITEKYQKDNLFVIILYARYLGDRELSDVDRKQDIIEFLDTSKKDTTIDPDQKWIRTGLDSLSRKLGYELNEGFRRAGNKLKDILIRDIDKEVALADVFVDRNDLTEAAYHRVLAYAIHNTLKDLEMLIGRGFEVGIRMSLQFGHG